MRNSYILALVSAILVSFISVLLLPIPHNIIASAVVGFFIGLFNEELFGWANRKE